MNAPNRSAMNTPLRPSSCLLSLAWWLLISLLAPQLAAQSQEEAVATLQSFSGSISIKKGEIDPWQYKRLADLPTRTIRAGWIIATGKNSRCKIILQDQHVIDLAPQSSVRFAKKEKGIVSRLFGGVISFFHRDTPGRMEVESSEVSAVIRGTEFVFAVAGDETTTLTLYDGEVDLRRQYAPSGAGAAGMQAKHFQSGDVVVTQKGEAPRRQTAVINFQNLEAIQWNLYYPAVVDLGDLALEPEVSRQLSDAMAAYKKGNLLEALAAYPTGRQPTTPAERVFYAALLLAAGNVSEAEPCLAAGLPEREARLAAALRLLIAATQLRAEVPKTGATNLLASEWLALSYAWQSHGELNAALSAARAASTNAPTLGFAWARVAELEFSFGRQRQAQQALEKALALSPENAQAWALRGFVSCAQSRFKPARQAFEQAILLDGALGNAWLGRGLCRIRQSDVVGGRQDLEIAASSEPQRSLLRSYLGKAFFEERQSDKAFHELELAAKIDPQDPTSWLYSALLKQNRNRINEAIADLEKSKQLNKNRQRFRSRQLLDQDQAVRSANLAALYQDAGMNETAVREASRAVNADYANASSHVFLANAYNTPRDPRQSNLRYETPWLSELLLASLLAPPGMGLLSQTVSQEEYSRLFDRNRAGFRSSTDYSSQGDWIQNASQYGQFGSLSYSLDAQYRDEHGQHANDIRQSTALYANVKIQLSPGDSVMIMANTLDYHAGDLRQYYDPQQAKAELRVAEYQDPNFYLAYHREWNPNSHTLFLVGRLSDTLRYDDYQAGLLIMDHKTVNGQQVTFPRVFPDFNSYWMDQYSHIQYERQFEAYSLELQQIWQPGDHTLIMGGRFQTSELQAASYYNTVFTNIPFRFFSGPVSQTAESGFTRASLYLYDQWKIFARLQIHLGAAYDYLDYPVNLDRPPINSDQQTADRFSPKIGLQWQAATNTHVYGAWTRSLGGAYYDQSVRLEPVQMAGFNQAFRSLVPESAPGGASGLVPAARFETRSLGLDHRFPTCTYVSLEGEWLKEEGEFYRGIFIRDYPHAAVPSTTLQQMDYDERTLTTTVNQLLGNEWSLGLRHRVSLAELQTRMPILSAPNVMSPNLPLEADGDGLLQEVRPFILYNHPCGFYSRFDAHWHTQSNGGSYAYMAGDDFWQFDLYAGYRFWQRRANLQLGLLNLAGQDYHLNPLNLHAELPHSRTLTVQLKLAF